MLRFIFILFFLSGLNCFAQSNTKLRQYKDGPESAYQCLIETDSIEWAVEIMRRGRPRGKFSYPSGGISRYYYAYIKKTQYDRKKDEGYRSYHRRDAIDEFDRYLSWAKREKKEQYVKEAKALLGELHQTIKDEFLALTSEGKNYHKEMWSHINDMEQWMKYDYFDAKTIHFFGKNLLEDIDQNLFNLNGENCKPARFILRPAHTQLGFSMLEYACQLDTTLCENIPLALTSYQIKDSLKSPVMGIVEMKYRVVVSKLTSGKMAIRGIGAHREICYTKLNDKNEFEIELQTIVKSQTNPIRLKAKGEINNNSIKFSYEYTIGTSKPYIGNATGIKSD